MIMKIEKLVKWSLGFSLNSVSNSWSESWLVFLFFLFIFFNFILLFILFNLILLFYSISFFKIESSSYHYFLLFIYFMHFINLATMY